MRVELHDGTILDLPDGTPVDAVREAARRHFAGQLGGSTAQPTQGAPEASQPFQRAGLQPNWGAPFVSGVADAGIKAGLGVAQLFGGLSDENKAVLNEMKKEKDADPNAGWRTTGDVAGNIALTALPGAAAEKALRGTASLPGILRSALAAGGSAAGTEAITSVGQGDTYGEQMASKAKNAGLAGMVGGTLGGAVRAITKPFQISAEGKALLDQGITPTLRQGAEGDVGKAVGGLSGNAFSGAVRRRQSEEIAADLLRRIAPGEDFAHMHPDEIIRGLDARFAREIDPILNGKIFQMTPTKRSVIWAEARKAAGPEADDVAKLLDNMAQTSQALRASNNVRLGRTGLQSQRARLQSHIDRYSGSTDPKDKAVLAGLVAAKNKFDQLVRNPSLSPDELARLSDIDARYFDFKRLEGAAKTAKGQKEFDVPNLVQQYSNMDPSGGHGFARATSQTQRELLNPAQRVLDMSGADDARAGMAGLRRTLAPWAAGSTVLGTAALGGPLVGIPLGAAYGASMLGQTKKGAEMLFGETEAQKKLAEMLRYGFTSPVAAGAVTQSPTYGE